MEHLPAKEVIDGRRESGKTKTPANTALVERQLLSGRSGDGFWGQIAARPVPLARLFMSERPRRDTARALGARGGSISVIDGRTLEAQLMVHVRVGALFAAAFERAALLSAG
jgi:hypothetical protein